MAKANKLGTMGYFQKAQLSKAQPDLPAAWHLPVELVKHLIPLPRAAGHAATVQNARSAVAFQC